MPLGPYSSPARGGSRNPRVLRIFRFLKTRFHFRFRGGRKRCCARISAMRNPKSSASEPPRWPGCDPRMDLAPFPASRTRSETTRADPTSTLWDAPPKPRSVMRPVGGRSSRSSGRLFGEPPDAVTRALTGDPEVRRQEAIASRRRELAADLEREQAAQTGREAEENGRRAGLDQRIERKRRQLATTRKNRGDGDPLGESCNPS